MLDLLLVTSIVKSISEALQNELSKAVKINGILNSEKFISIIEEFVAKSIGDSIMDINHPDGGMSFVFYERIPIYQQFIKNIRELLRVNLASIDDNGKALFAVYERAFTYSHILYQDVEAKKRDELHAMVVYHFISELNKSPYQWYRALVMTESQWYRALDISLRKLQDCSSKTIKSSEKFQLSMKSFRVAGKDIHTISPIHEILCKN